MLPTADAREVAQQFVVDGEVQLAASADRFLWNEYALKGCY